MIDKAILRYWHAANRASYGFRTPVVEIIDSHIEALDEIDRLRTALLTVLETLNSIDSKEFDEAIESITRLAGQ